MICKKIPEFYTGVGKLVTLQDNMKNQLKILDQTITEIKIL